jgi:glycosyltransferase involved in cell wall biosynthesis
MKPLQVLIVDSGMRSLGGHNYSYTRAAQAAFLARGCVVDVLTNRGLPSEVAEAAGFRPMFSCGAYDFPLGHGRARDLAYLYAQGRVFAEELDHALRCVLAREYDLVFCHTVADFELIGWSRFLARGRFPGVLAVVLRQTPRFRACHWLRRTLNPYWRLKPQNLKRLWSRSGGRFLLCTDSEPLSQDYAAVYPHRIATLPIPLDPVLFEASGTIAERYDLEDASLLRVGYLGDARAAKGFPLLPDLVSRTLASSSGTRFIIQCPYPGTGADQAVAPAGVADLERLAAGSPRVTLIPEKLSREDYAGLLRHLDVVVLPYLSDLYREATSGIFAEAAALGKPVVVPEDTWMADELRKTGGGTAFRRGNPADLASKLLAVLGDYKAYAAAAGAASASWRAFHSADSLVGILLTEAGRLRPRLD